MPDPDTVHRIPLDEIDDAALPRDRDGLDEAALMELRLSIAANGLRMPIELFALTEPRPPHRYGLLSGLRRLSAFRALHELTGQDRYAAIPAFLRAPETIAEALAAMVEENEIRADISPWERGRIALRAREQGVFATIEEAVTALFPTADRNKRARIRTLARMVEDLDGHLTAPERLSQQQGLRLAAACRIGFGEVIRTALDEASTTDHDNQWKLLQPILAEAERLPAGTLPTPADPFAGRPSRPRRVARHRHGLTIRRELLRDGWCLRFTGTDATSDLLDAVFDEIDRMFGPPE